MSVLNVDNVEKLFKSVSSESILLGSFKVFKPTKTNFIIFFICLIPSVTMGLSKNTINITLDAVGDLLNVILALFGIIFTGYAFFQALIDKQLLIIMINTESVKKENSETISKLQETNKNFVELMMLYIISIIGSLLIKLILNSMPADFLLFSQLLTNNIVAILMIQVYLVFNAIILWRMISFVFNVFQLFNLYAGAKALAIIRNEDE